VAAIKLRWLRFQPAPDRWLGIAAFAPLVAVVLHWIAAIQVLAFLAPIWLSSAFTERVGTVSPQDRLAAVVMAGLAALCFAVFIVMFGEDGGTLEILAPAFSADPPRVWSILAGYQWPIWLVSASGLLGSSVLTRRYPAIGYLGFATIVTVIAFVHWLRYRLGYDTLGASAPTVGSLVVVSGFAGLSWFIAGHRLLTRSHA
jgi:hypothetical protein